MTGLEFALPLIMGGVQSGMNMYNQQQRDKKERQWNLEDYNRQRQDALADFERTNQYNSPQQQMVRLRQAGLNPNLVYGKGADNTSAMVRSSNINKSTPTAYQIPEMPTTQIAQGFMDMKMKQAQTDNLAIQGSLMRKDEALKDANISKLAQDTATSQFQLDQAKRLKDLVVEQSITNLEKAKIDVRSGEQQIEESQSREDLNKQALQLNLNRDQREQLANSANVQKTYIDMLRSKAELEKNPLEVEKIIQEIEMIKRTNAITDWENQMRRDGINPKSNQFIVEFQRQIMMLKRIIQNQ